MAPDLVAEFVAAFTKEINSVRAAADQTRKHKEHELAGITRKLDGLIEAIAEGFRAESLQQKLEEFEARKIELEDLLAGPAPAPVRLHPNLAEIYRRKVSELEDALAEPEVRDEALSILRPLIEKIVLRPQENGFEIELIGEIVAMVALGQEARTPKAKKAALDAGTTCSVKVVAGARNQRYLQIAEGWLPRVS